MKLNPLHLTSSTLVEEKLLQRIAKKHDLQAFSDFYLRLSQEIRSQAARILRNKDEAEDVTQQVFMSLWKHAGAYDRRRGNVRTWLGGLVRNRCIDFIRKRKREQLVPLEEKDELEPIPIEENLNKREEHRKVLKALEKIPQPQQAVIKAAYFSGLTHQEIAGQSHLPLGTIKTRLRLGLSKLALIFRPEK